MKQIYICEKCGAQYDEYDRAYECECSHVNLQQERIAWGFTELHKRQTWKPGQRFPDKIYIPVEIWDRESQAYRKTVVEYKLGKELPDGECERIYAAEAERERIENEAWERRQREREAREQAEKEAKETA